VSGIKYQVGKNRIKKAPRNGYQGRAYGWGFIGESGELMERLCTASTSSESMRPDNRHGPIKGPPVHRRIAVDRDSIGRLEKRCQRFSGLGANFVSVRRIEGRY